MREAIVREGWPSPIDSRRQRKTDEKRRDETRPKGVNIVFRKGKPRMTIDETMELGSLSMMCRRANAQIQDPEIFTAPPH